MTRLSAFTLSLLVAGMLRGGTTERTIPVPKRDQEVKINFSSEGAAIETLRIQNYPDTDQVEKAKTKDPNDKSFVFWRFNVSNRSSRKVRMKIEVTLIGKDGSEVGHNDKTDSVDAEKREDTIRVMMHPKILDLVNAKSVRLQLSIEPK